MKYLRNNKILLLIIAALLVANIAMLYFYVWKKPSGSKRFSDTEIRERAKMKLEKEVGFSKEQLNLYDTLRTNHFESMKPMFEGLRASKDSFFNLILNKDPNTDSLINEYTTQVTEKQKAIDVKMLKYFRSLKELCTEEQRPKMDSFLQNITRRMSGGNFRRGQDNNKNKR